jgi:probable F420-dependent oxidoreductase
MTADYDRAGIPLDRAGIRIERLAEAISVLKGCFDEGPFDFDGDHYTIRGLDSRPKPRQRPHPKLIVAGGGPKVLSLAAREADIVGINFGLQAGVFDHGAATTGFAEATDAKLAVIRDQAGNRFDSLELQTRVHMAMITEDRDTTLREMAPAFGLTAAQAREMPHVLAGTPRQCADTMREWRDRWGISYVTWSADAMEAMAPVVELLSGT